MSEADQRKPSIFSLAAVSSPIWGLIPTGVIIQFLLDGHDAGPGVVVLFVTLPFAPGPPLALIALFRNERAVGLSLFAMTAYLVPGLMGIVYLAQGIERVLAGQAP